ncbi:MAG: hypothetical protein HYT83_00045 [Candidatus Levybacteria bacterium]|nr:hypothetical protein [Candidatus Levybacteria bacterium]
MIVTKKKPFTKEEVEKLREEFDTYIKTVIDVQNKVCSAGANRHFESEKILLDQGSKQSNLWGGGIDIETKVIDYNSFINIRPSDNNTSNEVLDPEIRKEFEDLTKYFFSIIYE